MPKARATFDSESIREQRHAMNTETAESMIGFLYTLPGLAVLLWALHTGILRRAPDKVMYQVVEDEQEPDEAQSAPPRPASPRRARWFLAIIAVIFTLVAISTIATVAIATMPERTGAAAAGKCPFF